MVWALLQLTVAATATVSATDSLEAIWRKSLPFQVFLEATRDHTDAWYRSYRRAALPDSLRDRARTVAGTWRIMVVTDVGCHDSINSIPALARLAEAVNRLELRVTDSRTGARLVDTRRTHDGRTATPTILVLDEAWNEVGVIVEHPKALIEFLEDHRLRRDDAEFRQRVQNWYERDRGVSVIAEVIDMVGRQDLSGSAASNELQEQGPV